MQAIADKEGVTLGTISTDVKAVRTRWAAERLVDFDDKVSKELDKIDELEGMAREAWFRSCDPAAVRVSKREFTRAWRKVRDEDGNDTGEREDAGMELSKANKDKTVKEQVGDPAFLDRIAWCIETRLKLLGLLSSKMEVQAGATVNINWDGVAVEDPVAARLAAMKVIEHKSLNGLKTTITEVKDGPAGSAGSAGD
jgi:hypothetical protein